ncbi:unnamed protein product [Parajaminaea phylloscopi]
MPEKGESAGTTGSNAPPSGAKGPQEGSSSVKGYVAGVASGLTKLAVGQPMDIVKVRMQTSPYGTYRGPWECFMQLARRESLLGLYKGASPVAVSWSISDAVLMGTLHNLRLTFSRWTGTGGESGKPLGIGYHALAGLGAGWTNSFIQSPAENLKTLLQVQKQRISLHIPGRGSHSTVPGQQFTGPVDAAKTIIRHHGVLGMWRTLPATLWFRSSFAVMFGSFEILSRSFASLKGTSFELSPGISTFLAGGLAAELFWLSAFPADAVKNLMMSDTPGALKYPTVRSAWREIWHNRPGVDASVLKRVRVLYNGFFVCLLRAFPTNASSIFVFEAVMGFMGAEKTTTTTATTSTTK